MIPNRFPNHTNVRPTPLFSAFPEYYVEKYKITGFTQLVHTPNR